MMEEDTTHERAMAIAEELLKRTGDAYVSGDAEAFADCFLLPQEIDTLDGKRLITTRAEIIATFEAMREYFRVEGITIMDRRCVSAEFSNPDTITHTHESRLLRGDMQVREPYPSLSVLRRVDGEWKIAYSQYIITDSPAHNRVLNG